jgi:hypothetical protein
MFLLLKKRHLALAPDVSLKKNGTGNSLNLFYGIAISGMRHFNRAGWCRPVTKK